MKKNLLLACLLVGSMTTYAQKTYNLFDSADVDADGWLWLDSQEKIDKYVGLANNEFGKVDADGKTIQLSCADFDPYEDSFADPKLVGVGTDKEVGGAEAKTGAIALAPAASAMSTTGGGMLLVMPSCAELDLMISSKGSSYVRLLGSADKEALLMDYTVISAKKSTVFSPLISGGGQTTWSDLETLDNGYENAIKLASEKPMVAYLQNLTASNIYIHGIRVITHTPTSGIEDNTIEASVAYVSEGMLHLSGQGESKIYSIAGTLVKESNLQDVDLTSLSAGLYLAKVTVNNSQKEVVKFIVK